MSKYQNISILMEEVADILDNLFTGGLSAVQGSTEKRMKAVAEECEKTGLDFAALTLSRMAERAEKRRHSIQYDYSELVSDFCLLGRYLQEVKNRIEIEQVKEILMSKR